MDWSSPSLASSITHSPTLSSNTLSHQSTVAPLAPLVHSSTSLTNSLLNLNLSSAPTTPPQSASFRLSHSPPLTSVPPNGSGLSLSPLIPRRSSASTQLGLGDHAPAIDPFSSGMAFDFSSSSALSTPLSSLTVGDLVYRAQLACHCGRHDEMCVYMKHVVERQKVPLTIDERNLFSLSFKKSIAQRRTAWRQLYLIEKKEKEIYKKARKEADANNHSNKENGDKSSLVSDNDSLNSFYRVYVNAHAMRIKVESEIIDISSFVIHLLHANLLPSLCGSEVSRSLMNIIVHASDLPQIENIVSPSTSLNDSENQRNIRTPNSNNSNIEEQVSVSLKSLESRTNFLEQLNHEDHLIFYLKMIADYTRYLCEVAGSESVRTDLCSQCLRAYWLGYTLSISTLSPTHPIRLGLVLNMTVFYYEVMSSPDRACQLAKRAFDGALAELNNEVSEEEDERSYKDATLIMQLLKNNLTLWTSVS